MDCNEAEEIIDSLMFGAPSPSDAGALADHVDDCEQCRGLYADIGETKARLAAIVPQHEVPPGVKQRLFTRIDANSQTGNIGSRSFSFAGIVSVIQRTFSANSDKLSASLVGMLVIVGAMWFNLRLDEVSQESQQLESQMEAVVEQNVIQDEIIESMAGAEAEVVEMVKRQRYLTYEILEMSTDPATSINMLEGEGWTSDARGMMVSGSSTEALLLTFDLPLLSEDESYQIWLIKNGTGYSAGTLIIDSTGYGQAVIIPVAPLADFDAIGITVEPSEGSEGPTGTSVLKGDL